MKIFITPVSIQWVITCAFTSYYWHDLTARYFGLGMLFGMIACYLLSFNFRRNLLLDHLLNRQIEILRLTDSIIYAWNHKNDFTPTDFDTLIQGTKMKVEQFKELATRSKNG